MGELKYNSDFWLAMVTAPPLLMVASFVYIDRTWPLMRALFVPENVTRFRDLYSLRRLSLVVPTAAALAPLIGFAVLTLIGIDALARHTDPVAPTTLSPVFGSILLYQLVAVFVVQSFRVGGGTSKPDEPETGSGPRRPRPGPG